LITKQKSNENTITHTKQNEKKFKAYYQNNIVKAQFSTNQRWKNKIKRKIKLKKKKKNDLSQSQPTKYVRMKIE
jgi:hypothetical protein